MEWIIENWYWLAIAIPAVVPVKYRGKVKAVGKIIYDKIQEKRKEKKVSF